MNSTRALLHVYRKALAQTGDRMERMRFLLHTCREKNADEAKKRDVLAQISVLGAYVKRRANLVLLSDRMETLPLSELHFCLRESNEALVLIPVSTIYRNSADERALLPVTEIMRLYDLFQSFLEASLAKTDHMKITLSSDETRVLLQLLAGGAGSREETANFESFFARSKVRISEKKDVSAEPEGYQSAKERIHDSLGQALLSTRYLLTEAGAKITTEEVLSLWEKTIDDLAGVSAKAEHIEENRFVRPLEEAAGALGAALNVQGRFPVEDLRLSRLVMACARVCIINAVRHGAATEVTIAFEQPDDAGESVFRISNNGRLFDDDWKEGGGLKSLRARVEEEGGSVFYETNEQFTVTVRVPKR